MHVNEEVSCDQCDYTFKSNKTMKEHKKLKHLGIKYICNECEWTGYRLVYHNKTKHNEETFNCTLCNFQTKARQHLANHNKRKHLIKGKVYCDQCDYESLQQDRLNYHKETKHPNLIYNCEQCDKVGMTKPALVNHKYDFHGKFTQCLLCDYKTRRKGNMKIHNQALHEGITYPCDICGYETST